MARVATRETSEPAAAFDVATAYADHSEVVWRMLHRLGVQERDLPDLTHDVFAIVVRRSAEFAVEKAVRPWLYGICVGLVRNYRRRAFRNRERLTDRVPDSASEDSAMSEEHKRQRAERLLNTIDPEKRAVFVMFEVEGMSGQAIADALGVPIGTVHSRLHAARRELLEALREEDAS
jgi:RNA polymerase sigma-70 factor, ECF subfamily